MLADIEEIAGREAALELALALGGQSVHIPRPGKLTALHPLAAAVGPGVAAVIAERHNGETLYVPRARGALVRHLAAQGLATRAIAVKLGISVRGVQQHRRRDQANMFA